MEPSQARLFTHLQNTSRSFYLGIAQLTEPLKTQVCLGYLLCRIFDCFEDATSVDPVLRHRQLLSVTELFEQIGDFKDTDFVSQQDWLSFFADQLSWDLFKKESPKDFALLFDGYFVFNEIAKLPLERRLIFVDTLLPMAHGMLGEIKRRQIELDTQARSLAEFREYCYWVAGTVGEFLTELFFAEGAFDPKMDREELKSQGRLFGRGLQIVNIAKDFFKDWNEGRCFWVDIQLPSQKNQTPPELDTLKNGFEVLVGELEVVKKSVEKYLNAISPRRNDVRFFCAFPFEMATNTMALGRSDHAWLEEQKTFKIDRSLTFEIANKLTSQLSL